MSNKRMNTKCTQLVALLASVHLLIACGNGDDTAHSTAPASMKTPASYTLCDCVLKPPSTDAELTACSALIDTLPPEDLAQQAIECKSLIAVPEGGPDECYCLTAESDDPAIRQACETLFDDIEPQQLVSLTRQCAAERVRQ